MKTLLVCCLATLALAHSPARAAESGTATLKPSSYWQMDYGTDRCRMVRTFGEGDDRTLLMLEQHRPSDTFRWYVAGKPFAKLEARNAVTAQFGPGFGKHEHTSSQVIELDGYGRGFRGWQYSQGNTYRSEPSPDRSQGGMPKLDVAQGAAIDWIEFSHEDRSIRLQTGNLENAFAALNQCVSDLVVTWGLDPAQQETIVKPPHVKGMEEVARRIVRHYPGVLERWSVEGDIAVRVMVSPAGRAVDCHIVKVVSDEDFGAQVCREFLRNARYEPARDAEGNAVASYLFTNISYRVP